MLETEATRRCKGLWTGGPENSTWATDRMEGCLSPCPPDTTSLPATQDAWPSVSAWPTVHSPARGVRGQHLSPGGSEAMSLDLYGLCHGPAAPTLGAPTLGAPTLAAPTLGAQGCSGVAPRLTSLRRG